MTSAELFVAVARAVHDYADAVDARSWPDIARLLAEDVQLTRGESTTRGITEFREVYRPFLESQNLGTRHIVNNLRIDATGPGTARARACFEATTFLPDLTRRVIGRYDDELALNDGRWLFTHKRNIVEWAVDLPAATEL